MEFGKFGVLVKIEDHVLACLVGLAILLVFKLKESFPSRSFPNLQVGSILGTLVGSAISATGLVGSRVGEDSDGKCDPLKTWQLHDDNDGNVNDVKNASVLHRQQPGACGPWWHCCRLFPFFALNHFLFNLNKFHRVLIGFLLKIIFVQAFPSLSWSSPWPSSSPPS